MAQSGHTRCSRYPSPFDPLRILQRRRLAEIPAASLDSAGQPVIFAFHGYPWLIHRLTCRRHGHQSFHVRGYTEEGTTTTPFDMCVLNGSIASILSTT